MLKSLLWPKIIILLILFLGAFLRFYNIDWDQSQHLHPDERFLTMVATSMKTPATFADYLNPQISTFNPANIGYQFYVYGTLPVIATKLLAIGLGADNYTDITLLGRLLSGFVDVLVIFVIYKTLALFEKRYSLHSSLKYWAAFFYAIAVLPIQLSHFFAVDTFLNFFVFTSFYFALRFAYTKNPLFVAISAIFFGLALGSKISAIYVAPLIAFFLFKAYLPRFSLTKKTTVHILMSCILFGLTTYLVGRIADPYLFQTGNMLDFHINALFLQNIEALKSWSNVEAWFPPSVQWINKTPILFPFANLVLFGIGIGFAFFVFYGVIQMVKKYKFIALPILVWAVLFFIYQGLQFSTTMRYFLPLYPFLAIIAAIGFYEMTQHRSNLKKTALLLPVIIWPMFFFSIYTQNHTRNDASQWIYANIPNGYTLLSEHWDDSLPLGINPPSQNVYTFEQLPVFDPDTQEKWDKMNPMLQRGNYLILSSNRGWGSIPTAPGRYPQMTQFYKDLFAGKTQYKKVAEFTSYPSLNYLGIPLVIPDDLAEEAFTVYDHPKVMIFENTAK